MRAFGARSGPFENRLRFSPAEIDDMCVEALTKAELLPSSPQAIRIERFIEKYFSCPVRYEDIGNGVLGCTVFRQNGSVERVIISTTIDEGHKTSERRIRSTLAHEGGHCLMHPILFMNADAHGTLNFGNVANHNLDFSRRRILCRESDVFATSVKAYSGRWWEWQANRAIGGFLLPKKLVRPVCKQFGQVSPVTRSLSLLESKRYDAERAVADVFDVNPVVARIRLAELFPAATGQLDF
jgi:hypothetical protein